MLARWNPTRAMLDMEREFNRFFNSLNNRYGVSKKDEENADNYENAVWSPLTDISEDENNYVLQVDLPGVKKDDLKINFNDGMLSISGERKYENEEKKKQFHRVERAFGKYYRSFRLPKEIQIENIDANFKEGTLTITVPKAEEAKPKEIEVKVS